MRKLNRGHGSNSNLFPIKVLQYGEGNFLRGFIEPAFQVLNTKVGFNAGVAVVQPIVKGLINNLNGQDGLYTLFTKGILNGELVEQKELMTAIVKGVDPYISFDAYINLAELKSLEFVVSNTTEAGIAFIPEDRLSMTPPKSFPAKLTQFLYTRFIHFNGAPNKGLIILPCELVAGNSDLLRKIVLEYILLWGLSDDFRDWVLHSCSFHNTLVDRIVPGYPKNQIEAYEKQLEYQDDLIVSAEIFFLWVVEGDEALRKKLPFHKTDLNVKIVDDLEPYRTRKVRILNGAHTAMVPFSILFGNTTVKETMDTAFTGKFIRDLVVDEIIPTLDMEKNELEGFAYAVFERFGNPYIEHQLASIALNSISKFKVRVLPSLLEYIKCKKEIPPRIVYSFACLIRFYKGCWGDEELPVNDDPEIMTEMAQIWKSRLVEDIAFCVLGKIEYWGTDLNSVDGLTNAIVRALQAIEKFGVEIGFLKFNEG